jgi:hypothetical protein
MMVLVVCFIFLIVNPGIFPQVQFAVFPHRTDFDAETARGDMSLEQSF